MFFAPKLLSLCYEEFVHSISRVCIELGNLESSQEARAALDFARPDLGGVNISNNETHLNFSIMPCNTDI